jgi:hypothetical protein
MLQQSIFCCNALLQCSTPSCNAVHHAARCTRAHLVCNKDHRPVSNSSTSHAAKACPSSCPLMVTCAHTTCTIQHSTRNRQHATCMQHAAHSIDNSRLLSLAQHCKGEPSCADVAGACPSPGADSAPLACIVRTSKIAEPANTAISMLSRATAPPCELRISA